MIKIAILTPPLRMMSLKNTDKVRYFVARHPSEYGMPYGLMDSDCEIFPENVEKPFWAKPYTDWIVSIKPDVIICINAGCSEVQCDEWIRTLLPTEIDCPVVTWSTDSYRHTKRCVNSTIHYSAIPDKTLTDKDKFLPLFAKPRNYIPLSERHYTFGICNNHYVHQSWWREKELNKLYSILDFRGSVDRYLYYDFIRQFRFGINIPVYSDGLPNFRLFEYLACGVQPIIITHDNDMGILKDLFPDVGEWVEKTEDILTADFYLNYDPQRLIDFIKSRHTFQHRLRVILRDLGYKIGVEDL